MHRFCIEKLPYRHLFIHPRWKLFHYLYGNSPWVLLNAFDITVFCFILNQSIVNQRKITIENNNFTGLYVFFKALNFRFWQVSQNFDCFRYEGETIDIVNNFNYLSIVLTSSGSFTNAMKTLSGKALKIFF